MYLISVFVLQVRQSKILLQFLIALAQIDLERRQIKRLHLGRRPGQQTLRVQPLDVSRAERIAPKEILLRL